MYHSIVLTLLRCSFPVSTSKVKSQSTISCSNHGEKIFRANLPHDLHTQTAEGQLNQLNQVTNAMKLNNIDVYDIRAFHQKQNQENDTWGACEASHEDLTFYLYSDILYIIACDSFVKSSFIAQYVAMFYCYVMKQGGLFLASFLCAHVAILGWLG